MDEWQEIRRPFREALISGFNWNSLSMVLRYHCDKRLDRITAESKGFDTNVDDVIDDALRSGWLEKLAKGALEENERHAGLAATVSIILEGFEAYGTAYYQGDVFEESRRESDPAESPTTQPIIYQVSGDLVYGDKREGDDIEVGSISGSEGIAIGRSSSASVDKSTSVEKSASAEGRKSMPTASTGSEGPEPDVHELHRKLVDLFNLEELSLFSRLKLGVDFDDISGTTKSAKALELVLYMQRRSRLHELDRAIREERG